MAEADKQTLDQVEVAIMGNADAQVNTWQSLVKDGRRITNVALNVAIDPNNGQRTFEVKVDYAQSPTQTINAPASGGAL